MEKQIVVAVIILKKYSKWSKDNGHCNIVRHT
jgi:hypothetical protein